MKQLSEHRITAVCTAKHPTKCPECEGIINQDDVIYLRDEHWICQKCGVHHE